LAVNVLQRSFGGGGKLARPLLPLALGLSIVPVLFGVIMHLRATEAALHDVWPFDITGAYVTAMIVAAVCCRIAAHLHRQSSRRVFATYLFSSAAAIIVGAAALLSVSGVKTWDHQAP